MPPLHAEIIDRIVAIVGGDIITQSDIRKERALLPAFGEEAGDEKSILQSLISRRLVEQEIAQFPGIDVTDMEVDEDLRARKVPPGVTPEELRNAVRRRLERAQYFNLRFRQFIRVNVTDEEVRQYYNDVFSPKALKDGLNPVPPFEQVRESLRDLVRDNVIDEKLSKEVTSWLEGIRKRSKIEEIH